MKKKNLLLCSLASILLLAGCGAVETVPTNVEDPIVDFEDTKVKYFRNEFQTVYDQLVSSGTSNATILDEALYTMAKAEIGDYTKDGDIEAKGFTTKKHIDELLDKKMVDRVKGGSYNQDGLFYEEKYVLELKTSLYDIKGTDYNNGHQIRPTDTYSDLFKCDYSDYREKVLLKETYRELLTAKYLYDEDYSSLGRSYARDVQYIKIENISDRKDAAVTTLNKYLGDFLNDNNKKFDLNFLANIWKGVEDQISAEEKKYIDDNNLYTLSMQIEDEIKRIVKVGQNGEIEVDQNGNYILLDDEETDSSLESKYTNGSYPVAWGHELALRELESKDIVQDDVFVKSIGISDLPSQITTRLFSSTVASFCSDPIGVEGEKITFLLPESTENIDKNNPSKYIHYNADEDAYFIVIVKEAYNTSVLSPTADKPVSKEKVLSIAEALAQNSSNSREALIHYFKEFDVSYHDDGFYEYIKETYPEIFEED